MKQPDENDIGPLMQEFAKIAVSTAENGFGVHLDYSEQSLTDIDNILYERWQELLEAEHTDEQLDSIWTISKVWGGYVGEIICRNMSGVWHIQTLESGQVRT